jgi:hypothetical protein
LTTGCEPKVANLWIACMVNEYVVRLQVSVDDAVAMNMLQAFDSSAE